jgi:hypothetical protein
VDLGVRAVQRQHRTEAAGEGDFDAVVDSVQVGVNGGGGARSRMCRWVRRVG